MMKKVISIIVALAILFSIAVPVSVVAATKVSGVRQTQAGTSYFTVEWDQYSTVTRYKVEYSTNMYSGYTTDNDYAGSSETVYTNFAGKTYYVKVTPYVNGSWLTSAASNPIEVVTTPKRVENLKQSGISTNSIKLTWSASSGAQSYNIYKYYSSTNVKKIGSTTTNSYTIKGLSNKKNLDFYYIYVRPVRKSASYTAEGDYEYVYYYYLKLTPQKGKKPSTSYYWYYGGEVYFKRPDLKYQDGYQIKIYKANKKKAVKTLTNKNSCKLKKGQAYKVKTRSYTLFNSKKVYGKWSGYNYFVAGLKTYKITSKTKHSVKLKWSKPKGGKFKYDIYVSRNYNKGKKKTLKNIKKNSVTVRKIGKKSLKKGTYYYFYLVPKIKVGKKYKTSDIIAYVWGSTKY